MLGCTVAACFALPLSSPQIADFLPSKPAVVRESVATASATRAAVVVGADSYPHLPAADQSLGTARVTGERLREALVAHAGFAPAAVTTLYGDRVHAREVKASILAAGRQIAADDGLLLVSWAGHGWTRPRPSATDGQEQFLFTTYSREEGQGFSDGVSVGDLVGWLSEARAEARKRGLNLQPVLWIDACRVGRGTPPGRVTPIPMAAWQVFGAKDGQMVSVGQGSEPFLFTGTLLARLADYARLGQVSLKAAFADCEATTKERSRGAQSPDLVVPSDPSLAGKMPLLVVPRRVSLRVRCIDALAGVPIEGAALRVNDFAMAMTADRGEQILPPGRVVLTARAGGYLGRTDELDLAHVATGLEVELPLVPSVAVVRGRLVPPAFATVAATGGPAAREDLHRMEQVTGRDGTFELRVPVLADSELRIVQKGRVLQRFTLPAEPGGFLRDREGLHDGVPFLEMVCELTDATLAALGADSPPIAVDGEPHLNDAEDRVDWEQAKQSIAAKRWDLARTRLRRIRGDALRVGAMLRQVEARWAIAALEQVLSRGKTAGDWSGLAALKEWWGAKPEVDERERIEALFAEVAREEVSLAVRKAFECGNKAFGDGELEAALVEYGKAMAGANAHYTAQIEEQRRSIRTRLYRRHSLRALDLEMNQGDIAGALAEFAKAMQFSDRARDDVDRLLSDSRLPEKLTVAHAASLRPIRTEVANRGRLDEILRRTDIAAGLARLEERFAILEGATGTGWLPTRIRHRATGIVLRLLTTKVVAGNALPTGTYLGETEVTVAQWRRFAEVDKPGHVTDAERAGAGGTPIGSPWGFWQPSPGASWRDPLPNHVGYRLTENDPAVQISWNDASAFCTHYALRLPTAAEWCDASASDGRPWSWGERPARAPEFANFAGRETSALGNIYADFEDAYPTLAPVRSFLPNRLGFYDLHGNVSEWCADPAMPVADKQPGRRDEYVASGRVLCGGSWIDHPLQARVSDRARGLVSGSWNFVGFRVALSFPE